jgi:hypothetical protein
LASELRPHPNKRINGLANGVGGGFIATIIETTSFSHSFFRLLLFLLDRTVDDTIIPQVGNGIISSYHCSK